MKRIYQTIVVSIALLFCMQTAHAAFMPVSTDGNFFTIAAPGPSSVIGVTDDANYVHWFQFTLASSTDITLTTHGSVDDVFPFIPLVPGVLDTVLALYDYSFDINGAPTDDNGDLLAQNDDCGSAITSCLTFSDLAAGSYLAGITLSSNSPFRDNWETQTDPPTNESVPFLEGTTQLNLNVSPVPVPAAIWLFGSALIGFVGMSRRRSVKS